MSYELRIRVEPNNTGKGNPVYDLFPEARAIGRWRKGKWRHVSGVSHRTWILPEARDEVAREMIEQATTILDHLEQPTTFVTPADTQTGADE